MHNTIQYKNRELFIGSINSWKHYHGNNWAKNLCHYVTELITRVDKAEIILNSRSGMLFVTPHQPAPFKNM